jgi:hypothetical protein
MDEQQQPEHKNDVFAKKYADMTTIDIVRAMASLAKDKESKDAELSKIAAEYDYVRMNLIPARFEDEGIDGMTIDGVGRVSLTGDLFVSCLAANREALYSYFRDIGKGSLVVETINASTLKATVKAMMKKGEEIPEMIKVTPFTRASITKR